MRNKIEMYIHCLLCLQEVPGDTAPADWARLNVGMTENGMQVWCVRHQVSVAALDLRGQKIVEEEEDEDEDEPNGIVTSRPRTRRSSPTRQ